MCKEYQKLNWLCMQKLKKLKLTITHTAQHPSTITGEVNTNSTVSQFNNNWVKPDVHHRQAKTLGRK